MSVVFSLTIERLAFEYFEEIRDNGEVNFCFAKPILLNLLFLLNDLRNLGHKLLFLC